MVRCEGLIQSGMMMMTQTTFAKLSLRKVQISKLSVGILPVFMNSPGGYCYHPRFTNRRGWRGLCNSLKKNHIFSPHSLALLYGSSKSQGNDCKMGKTDSVAIQDKYHTTSADCKLSGAKVIFRQLKGHCIEKRVTYSVSSMQN